MLAQDPGGTKIYVPKEDRDLPEDRQLQVELRLFTVADQTRFANRGGKKPGTLMKQVLSEGVVGWTGLEEEIPDPENPGKKTRRPVNFEGVESLNRLPLRVRRELADALMDMSEPDEDEELG